MKEKITIKKCFSIALATIGVGIIVDNGQIDLTQQLGGLLYLGIISTAGGFLLWNKGLRLMNASSDGLFFFFQPIVGTFLGRVLLEETIGLTFWLGVI